MSCCQGDDAFVIIIMYPAACVPHLRERHGDDLAVASGNAVKHLAPEGIVLIGQKLRHLFPLIFVKAELIGHFLRRLVADGDIQIGAGDDDFRFYDVPVPIVLGFNDGFRLGRGAG